MTNWLNPYSYVKSTPKEQIEPSIDGITGEKGSQLFTSLIYGAMQSSELGENVCRLFPMKQFVACNIEGTKFAVQFERDFEAKIAKIEALGEKQLEGATFSIPRIIKGSIDPMLGKLEFADAAHALKVSLLLCDKQVGWGTWSKQVSASSPFLPLYSVQYVEKTDAFILSGISNLSMTVPRAVFEATFKNYQVV